MAHAALYTQYRRLAQEAVSAEHLCDHPVTRRYAQRFSHLEQLLGRKDARAWLLGTLLFDHHPETDPTNPHPTPHPGPHSQAPHLQPPHSTPLQIPQQHPKPPRTD